MTSQKLRWYVLRSDLTISMIADGLRNTPYVENDLSGFEVDVFRDDFVESIFVEKKVVSINIENPFGENESFQSISYVQVKFRISRIDRELSLLTLSNPPRSLKAFFSKLSAIFGGKVFVDSLRFDILKFYKYFVDEKTVERYQVSRVSANSIPFTEKSFARIEVVSDGDAFKELTSKYKNLVLSIDKLEIKCRAKGEDGVLVISNTGLISCSNNLMFVVEKYVLGYLLKLN